MKQMATQIEEEELERQSEANLNGHYVVDGSTSYHEQAITTIKNGEVVETHGEERNEEQIEAPFSRRHMNPEPLLLVTYQEIRRVVC